MCSVHLTILFLADSGYLHDSDTIPDASDMHVACPDASDMHVACPDASDMHVACPDIIWSHLL